MLGAAQGSETSDAAFDDAEIRPISFAIERTFDVCRLELSALEDDLSRIATKDLT